ncbi:MAG TPA: hypothetical protein VH022_14440 [Candidatus Acidoferrum sp.]|nr:hypothetical protein [Candidatus Acidoferrum sp.]
MGNDIDVHGSGSCSGISSGSPGAINPVQAFAYVAAVRLNNSASTVANVQDGYGNTYAPLTDSGGNPIRINSATLGAELELWLAFSDGGGAVSTVTVTSSNGADTFDCVLLGLNNLENHLPLDTWSSAAHASSGSFSDSLTSSVPGVGLVFTFVGNSNFISSTSGVNPVSIGGLTLGYQVQSASNATTTANWTLHSASTAISLLVSLKADPPPCTYVRKLTVDHNQCGTADSSNFPVLVSLSGTYLKTVGNGGKIQSSSGFDIFFSSDPNGLNLYSWELELFDGSAGTLIAWVRLPSISHSVDTVFYMTYGNGAVSTSQGGLAGAAWDSNSAAVYHCKENAGTTAIADSTANANNATCVVNTSTIHTTGQIDGGFNIADGTNTASVSGSSSLNLSGSPVTLECWIKCSGVAGQIFKLYDSSSPFEGYAFGWGQPGSNPGVLRYWSGGLGSWVGGSAAINDSNTHFVLVTCDGSGNLVFYVDGNQDATGSSSAPNLYTGTKTLFYQGAMAVLDEVRVSNTVRSSSWVKAEYNNQKASSTFLSAGAETLIFPPLMPERSNINTLLRM